MAKVALVFAYGLNSDGELNKQGAARCAAAFQLYRRKKVEKIIITCATEVNGVYIGDKMFHHFSERGVSAYDVLGCFRGYNTAGEIDGCQEMIQKTDEVTAVSSWYHLPRIWFLWLVRGRLVKLAVSFDGVVMGDLLIEPLKMVNSMLRPFSSSKLSTNAPLS